MQKKLHSFMNDQSGVTAIEYALLAMLIAMAVIVSVAVLGGEVRRLWERVANAVVNAVGG